MDFDSYDLDATFYDEMFEADGSPRSDCRQLHEALLDLSAEELASIQERVTSSFSNEGITFTVYGDAEADERIIPVDCVPRVLSSADWRHLESGLAQRLKTLNLFLEDVYGEAKAVADGVIPADVVYSCPQYRTQMRGFSAPNGTWVSICGTDLIRTNDGFRVLEDNLRVPSGVSYMIANRKAVKARFPPPLPRLPGRGGRALRQHPVGDPARDGAPGALQPLHRPADARGVQLRLLRAHVPGRGDRRRAGGGPRSGGGRRLRVHAHHPWPAAGGRDLPPRRRRLHRPAGLPPRFDARRARPAGRLPAGQRGVGERPRHRRGRRQERPTPT